MKRSEAKLQANNGVVVDAELEQYRNLLQPPTSYRNGFTWVTVAGAFFCGLVMLPGAIYLGLLSGAGMGAAASWVTVIVFSEITRRALRSMSKEEMIILLSAAGGMVSGGPFAGLIYRAFLVNSDAIKDAGLFGQLPTWYAPPPDSSALAERTFLHGDWGIPIAFVGFMTVIGFIKNNTLGYALFRLTSDVEKLPFPMAPVHATGAMALSDEASGQRSSRWTIFSVGTMLGLVFGVISVGVPAVSSAFLEKPIFILPIPWFEFTQVTEKIMPATPTGLIVDLGLVLVGFVVPFWAIIGSASAVVITFFLNPILHRFGMLGSWRPGMDTINTQISNQMDFYFSAGLGFAFGIAAVSIFQTVRQLRVSLKNMKKREQTAHDGRSIWDPPKGRGDWPLKLCFFGYFVAAGAVVAVCMTLVPGLPLVFLILLAFVYTPLISYLNARISGIAGQHIEIPFVREAFILLSGVKGVEVWLLPLPVDNFGAAAQGWRSTELTGVKFTSGLKLAALVTPLLFILSFTFWSFIWKTSPIPSDLYPQAQKFWDLQARQTMIMWTATTGQEGTQTLFQRSFHPNIMAGGFAFSVITFTVLSLLGMPTMLVYGLARGLGSMPHGLLLELGGACLARFYFHKKYGKETFLKAAPVLVAGYAVGTGLIGMAAVAIRLIMAAISPSRF